MQETFEYLKLTDRWGDEHTVAFDLTSYTSNNTLAIAIREHTGEYGDFLEPYANLTVNLEDSENLDFGEAYIDTNNLGSKIINWLEDNNLGHRLYQYSQSGYVSYPAFRFDLDEVKKYACHNLLPDESLSEPDEDNELEEDFDGDSWDLEVGFNPYEGGYDFDL